MSRNGRRRPYSGGGRGSGNNFNWHVMDNAGDRMDDDMDDLASQLSWTTIQPRHQRRGESGSSACSSGITAKMRKTNNFPFLSDEETVKYIADSKVMFILRGLPGSGKSLIAQLITEVYPNAISCSADDFFTRRDGSYRFDRRQLPSAHASSQDKAKDACIRGCSVVIIDNTNIKMEEFRPYTDMSGSFNYTVITVQPRTPWKFNATELARRTNHGVNIGTIQRRIDEFEEGIPLYYGWFLSESHSRRVRQKANEIFNTCKEVSTDFLHFISSLTFNQGRAREGANISSIYEGADSDTSLLHCTSYYANNGKDSLSPAYHKKPAFKAAIGKVHILEILGFVFTNQTAGARVRLDDSLLPLFIMDDGMGARVGRSGRSRKHHGDSFSGQRGRGHGSRRFRPIHGPGSRAHLTLGYISQSEAVQTGLDLLQVVELEGGEESSVKSWRLSEGDLRCYDDQYWVVYLDQAISINALFSGKY